MNTRLIFLLALTLSLAAESSKTTFVSAGSAVSEIACRLGISDHIVGVDSTSTFPASLATKPVVGYVRALSSEGIISTGASCLITTEDAGPPLAIQQLKDAGIDVHQFPIDYSVAGVAKRIQAIGAAINKQAEAKQLADSCVNELNTIIKNRHQAQEKISALYILHPRGGSALVGGKGSSAAGLFQLLGLKNAADAIDGWKPISAEAIVSNNPSILLIGKNEYESIGKKAGLAKLPGIALCNAFINDHILVVDHGEMLSFGPRLCQALKKLDQMVKQADNE